MSYTPTGFLAKENQPGPQHKSSLYSHMTANGRDPVREEYLRLAGHVAGTNPDAFSSSPTRIRPPWKIG